MHSTNTLTTATSSTAFGHSAIEAHGPRRWAVALAVLALLGLALLSFAGAEFGPQLTAAAEAAQAQVAGHLGDLEGVLAGIRWVR